MELYVLNENLEIVGLLDVYNSIQWNKKYNDPGDFVLNVAHTPEVYATLKKRNYIAREDSDRVMIIEAGNTSTSENENNLVVSGRTAETLLEWRIIWSQTNSKAGETAEDFIRRLITENAISPADPARKIPRLKLGERKGFTEKIEKQLTGDNLLTAIIEICKNYNYGFKMTVNENSEFVFDLFKGVDRSYNQNNNPYVVFSEEFENLANTELSYDEKFYKNVALIGGEGEGKDRKFQTVGNTTGLNRREVFIDAKDISSNSGEIQADAYNKLLQERGKEKLAETAINEEYAGDVDSLNTYVVGVDYNIGDIVQIENENGVKATAQITGILESNDTNGYRIIPTFEKWEK